jgi:XTP/dITP diphosphohydrolase
VTTFVLATANRHKSEEMRAIFGALGIEVLDRPANIPDVDETADTLEGNALLKARAVLDATGEAAVADDTGLFVDALGGRPGVLSARYAGMGSSYQDNVEKLLSELSGVSTALRTARFRTVIAVVYPDGKWFTVEGTLEGSITKEVRGTGGFGYDPVFAPDGLEGRTLAELEPEEKNELSHRANALRALAAALAEQEFVHRMFTFRVEA